MQRGAGICLTKSDPEREEAAAKFVKWLTEPEKNVQFVTSVGYMPVTEKAFELLPEAINNLTNEKYKSLYHKMNIHFIAHLKWIVILTRK